MKSPEVQAIIDRAAEANVELSTVLKAAGVAQSTWYRWNEGLFEPRLKTLRKIDRALHEATQGRAA